jgi:hypothetical protein
MFVCGVAAVVFEPTDTCVVTFAPAADGETDPIVTPESAGLVKTLEAPKTSKLYVA